MPKWRYQQSATLKICDLKVHKIHHRKLEKWQKTHRSLQTSPVQSPYMPGSPYTLTITMDTPQKSLAHAHSMSSSSHRDSPEPPLSAAVWMLRKLLLQVLRKSMCVLRWLNSPQTFWISWCHNGKAANTSVFMSSPKDELLTSPSLHKHCSNTAEEK